MKTKKQRTPMRDASGGSPIPKDSPKDRLVTKSLHNRSKKNWKGERAIKPYRARVDYGTS